MEKGPGRDRRTIETMALIKRREPTTVEEEREALREQRLALEDLKHELADRVAAVRERELELQQALKDTGRTPRAPAPAHAAVAAPANGAAGAARAKEEQDLALREQALASREGQLAERERALEQRSAEAHAALNAREEEVTVREAGVASAPADEPPPEPGAERLAEIEARLEELREAEKMFLRTRDELAARSEAVAARERLVSQKERELDDQEDVAGNWNANELSEMEARLRRLEQQTPGEQTANFAGGLRKLQQGSKRPQRPA